MSEVLIGAVVSVLILITGFGIIFWKLNRSSTRQGVNTVDELNKQLAEMTSGRKVAEEKISWLNEHLQTTTTDVQRKEATILDLSSQISRKEAEVKAITEKFTEQKAEIEKLQDKFRIEFKNLANEILEEKTQKFTEQNKIRLDEILKPLSEKIRDFEKRVEETYDKESKQRFSLEKEIKHLAELNQQIGLDANNLTNALKGQSKIQIGRAHV